MARSAVLWSPLVPVDALETFAAVMIGRIPLETLCASATG